MNSWVRRLGIIGKNHETAVSGFDTGGVVQKQNTVMAGARQLNIENSIHPMKQVLIATSSIVLAFGISPWFLVLTGISLAMWAYEVVKWVMG